MIYRSERVLFFVDHAYGQPISNLSGEVKGYACFRSGEKVYVAERYKDLKELEELTHIEISNWDIRSLNGWLAISKYSSRIGFVVGEDTDSYHFYVLDDAELCYVGTTLQIKKDFIERLPVGFSFMCHSSVQLNFCEI